MEAARRMVLGSIRGDRQIEVERKVVGKLGISSVAPFKRFRSIETMFPSGRHTFFLALYTIELTIKAVLNITDD